MSIKIKTIKGRQYYYDDVSQRVAGKVVTKSKYLGAVTPKRNRLTLGIILGGLMRASAQSFAPKHAKKEHQTRARAPDPRSQAAERERWTAFAHNDPKAAIADVQARARTASVAAPVNADEVQTWKDWGDKARENHERGLKDYLAREAVARTEFVNAVASYATAREAPAAPSAPETSSPAPDAPASVGGEQTDGGET